MTATDGFIQAHPVRLEPAGESGGKNENPQTGLVNRGAVRIAHGLAWAPKNLIGVSRADLLHNVRIQLWDH
jgi:hypothetical protein